MLKWGFGLCAGVCWLAAAACSSTTSSTSSNTGGSSANNGQSAGASAMVGGDTTLPEVDASTPVGFCQGYYAIVADLFARCWGVESEAVRELLPNSKLCDTFTASVDEGRVAYDPGPAKVCLKELASALTCTGADPSLAPDCTVLKPLVATGGMCATFSALSVNECLDGGYCQESDSYACSGVCTQPAADGAACDPLKTDVRCGPNSKCDSSTKTCVARLPKVGQDGACGATGLGDCEGDLWCEGATSDAAGVCHAKRSDGPCTSNVACLLPAVCAGATDSKACVAAKSDGASCTPGWRECSVIGHCGADKKCSSNGVALGEPCGNLNGESIPCSPDGYCDGAPTGGGTCAKKKQPGDACTGKALGECDGERGHCDSATQQCAACQ